MHQNKTVVGDDKSVPVYTDLQAKESQCRKIDLLHSPRLAESGGEGDD